MHRIFTSFHEGPDFTDALVELGAVLPLVAVGADSLAIEAVVEIEVPTAGSAAAAGRLPGFEHLVDSGEEHPQRE